MICASCGKEFNQTIEASGRFCQRCCWKINLKMNWRGYRRRLKVNVKMSQKTREEVEEKMRIAEATLLVEFGIDMKQDIVECSGKNIKH